MNRTLIYIAGMCFLFSAMQLCADYPGNAPAPGTKTTETQQSLPELKQQRMKLMKERQQLKVRIIRNDLRLRRLRERLLRLARELASELDTKPQIRKLNEEIMLLDRQIRKMEAEKK